MKKYIICATMAVLFLTTACDSDFIDKSPELQVSEASIFESSTRLAAAVDGVYGLAKNEYFLGGFASVAGDNRTDDMMNYGNNSYTMRDTYLQAVNASSLENDRMFYRAYLAINYANIIINGIENTYAGSLPCDEQVAKKYLQECKFIRAISFYYLSQLFGQPYSYNPDASNIPMRTEAVASSGENDCPASSIKAVLEQILSDTEDVSTLPVGYGATGFSATKASQAAAHALRMRVYMCMENWSKAIEEGNQISGFSLISSIATMFDSPYANTAENIFSEPMTDSDKSGSQSHPTGFYTHNAGDITIINNINGIAVSYGIADDARTSFIYKGSKYWFCEKYNEFSTRLEWIPIFRYAEILLNLSECYYNIGNEESAIACLKQVRTRSIAADKDPLVTYNETGSALWTAIDNERRWEFISEGLRGYDISRRSENYRHPNTDGTWEVIATPDDRTSYCWAFPIYETTVNKVLSE